MAEKRGQQRSLGEGLSGPERPWPRTLAGVLRRMFVPRGPEILVMERDGRLVNARKLAP